MEENSSKNEARSNHVPPGSLIARLLKQFWYLIICGPYVAFLDLVKDAFIKAPQINFDEIEKRTGQVAVMTGGTKGIGFEIVKKLLKLDYTIILGVRNIPATEEALESIRKSGISTGRVLTLNLDLKSLNSVRRFANDVLVITEAQRIDLIVNNAGVMNVPYEQTEDGFESHFQINYLGHFLLTNLLLPRMKETASKKSDPCYIINTSSHAQKGGHINFDELETSKVYSAIKCYFDSKLCQVIHAKTLERQFKDEGTNIHAYAVHPGEISTDIWNDLGIIAVIFRPMISWFCRTTDGAANTVLYPFLSPELANKCGGNYFETGKIKDANPQASNQDIQNKLWEKSLEITSTRLQTEKSQTQDNM